MTISMRGEEKENKDENIKEPYSSVFLTNKQKKRYKASS